MRQLSAFAGCSPFAARLTPTGGFAYLPGQAFACITPAAGRLIFVISTI